MDVIIRALSVSRSVCRLVAHFMRCLKSRPRPATGDRRLTDDDDDDDVVVSNGPRTRRRRLRRRRLPSRRAVTTPRSRSRVHFIRRACATRIHARAQPMYACACACACASTRRDERVGACGLCRRRRFPSSSSFPVVIVSLVARVIPPTHTTSNVVRENHRHARAPPHRRVTRPARNHHMAWILFRDFAAKIAKTMEAKIMHTHIYIRAMCAMCDAMGGDP